MAIGFLKLIRDVDLSAFLHGLVPVAWFLTSIPVFVLTIHQPPGLRRWALLPLNVLGPAVCFLEVDRLLGGLDWLWVFTSIVYLFHATSGLYLERWVLPLPEAGSRSPSKDGIRAGLKAWNNPRRLPIPSPKQQSLVTQRQRALFGLRKVGIILIHWAAYLFFEFGTLFALQPLPRQFASPTYFHFGFDRAALLRAVYCLQWAWLSYFILTVANAVCAILFVNILQLDTPKEWPSLWGNPLQVHSIRSFWGVFWHKIGSPSQLNYGRLITRHVLGLKPGSSAEKMFIAFFVFMISGSVHTMTNWLSKKTAPIEDIYGDMLFLLLNFGGGLLELSVERMLVAEYTAHGKSMNTRNAPRKRPGGNVSMARRILGPLWVFVFFYCIVPPWQYPYTEANLRRRFFPFKVDIQFQRPKASPVN